MQSATSTSGERSSRIRVSVRYFGPAGEWAGRTEERVEVAAGATLAAAVAQLQQRYAKLSQAGSAVRWAVNADFAAPDCVLHDGDDVAVIPPVSGG